MICLLLYRYFNIINKNYMDQYLEKDMNSDYFGKMIREKRQQCGLSQFQLGKLLNVTDKAISKWENNLARPKSHLLYQLSTILGVTIDQLFTGGEGVSENTECALEGTRKSLWNNVYDKFMDRYNGMPPLEIVSRYENEKLALMNSEMLPFYEVIAKLSEKAHEQKETISVEGGIGASFIAYLMGASDINPLQAHYYCPVCKRVEIVPDVADGWDLPEKKCSICNTLLERDGHDLPFEVYRHVINRNVGFDLVVSGGFYDIAKEIIIRHFSGSHVAIINPPKQVITKRRVSKLVTYVIQSNCLNELECDTYDDYYNLISDKPYINIIFEEDHEKYTKLKKMVETPDDGSNFLEERVINTFLRNVGELSTNKLSGLPFVCDKFQISSLKDAIQAYGISLCAAAFSEKAPCLYLKRQASLSQSFAYRDDIFLYLRSKMKVCGYYEYGFAFAVMDKTRKGIFYRNGMDQHTRKLLLDINVSEQYIACLEETPYLFPKAQGIVMLKKALVLLWYRIHFPAQFQQVFGGCVDDK